MASFCWNCEFVIYLLFISISMYFIAYFITGRKIEKKECIRIVCILLCAANGVHTAIPTPVISTPAIPTPVIPTPACCAF